MHTVHVTKKNRPGMLCVMQEAPLAMAWLASPRDVSNYAMILSEMPKEYY